jgi:hypothetical protein
VFQFGFHRKGPPLSKLAMGIAVVAPIVLCRVHRRTGVLNDKKLVESPLFNLAFWIVIGAVALYVQRKKRREKKGGQ